MASGALQLIGLQTSLGGGVTVSSAQPVGVWRTHQTHADLPVREELDATSASDAASSAKHHGILLTACLIVRDEQSHLPACLEGIAPLVDEIVLVDTGSKDRTKDIARAYQAHIFDFPWCDNFAAARNEALHHARGEWILQIDADEVVQPFPRARLRQLLSAGDVGAYYTLLRRHPALTPNWQMKLFRNNRQLRHSAVIHEAITPSLLRATTGMNIACFRMLIEHSGYTGDQFRKHARNLPLLLRSLQDEPDHPNKAFIWGHLADIHEDMGNHSLAASARVQSLRVLAAKGALHPVDCALYLGRLTSLVARQEDASAFLDDVTRRFPDSLQLSWIRGHWLIERSEFQDAADCFEHLLERGRTRDFGYWVGYDRRLFGELSYRSLAVCAAGLGREQECRRYQQLSETARSGAWRAT